MCRQIVFPKEWLKVSRIPDFETIKHASPSGSEYWSARDLLPLLGYKNWQNFEIAIRRAKIACEQVGQILEHHFTDASKPIVGGKGAVQNVKDYLLSRFACYLIAQNGDPRKPEIAAAQAYFATSTRENELYKLYTEQQERLARRERIEENTNSLKRTVSRAGVLPKDWGKFENAGYEGLYNGLNKEAIKAVKGIDPKEDILDRMGKLELSANDFRITQTEDKVSKEGIVGLGAASTAHQQVGETVRKAIEKIGGTLPEELPTEPSIKPLLTGKRKKSRPLPQRD